jgi:hypothetical protein
MKKFISILISTNLLNSLHFVKKWEIPSGDGSGGGSVCIGDANRNGKIELYLKQSPYNNNYFICDIYELDGTGNWIRVDSIICGAVPFPSGIGDLDSDGYMDILGRNSVYESSDSFSYPKNKVWENDSITIHYPGAYDIDQDGFPEIVTIRPYGKIGIYESRGDNQYELIFEEYPGGGGPHSTYAFGDFDDDGKIEFVSGDLNGNYWIYEARGNDVYYKAFEGHLPTYNILDCFSVSDADCDGKKEFVIKGASGTVGYDVFIFEATQNNQYNFVYLPINASTGYGGGISAAGDVDADSIPEIVLSARYFVFIIKADSDNHFYICDTIDLFFSYHSAIAIWDVDGNNLNDIIICNVSKTLIYEKGIDMEWFFPVNFDTFYAGETLNLKWRVYDTISLDSVYIYFKECPTGSPRELIYQGFYKDTTCSFIVPDTQGVFIFWLIAKGFGRKDSIHSAGFRILKQMNTKEFSKKIKEFPIQTFLDGKLLLPFNPSNKSYIYIYNTSGRKVFEILPKGKVIDLTKFRLSPGIYFLRIDSEKIKKIEKIIYLRK